MVPMPLLGITTGLSAYLLPTDSRRSATLTKILVENLVVQYLDYTEKEVDYSEGTRSRITYVLRMLNDLYGKQPVSMFGPTALKTFRQQFIDKELSRNTINGYIGIARQLFTWGGGEEIIPADIASALRIVKDLRRGRTTAVDMTKLSQYPMKLLKRHSLTLTKSIRTWLVYKGASVVAHKIYSICALAILTSQERYGCMHHSPTKPKRRTWKRINPATLHWTESTADPLAVP